MERHQQIRKKVVQIIEEHKAEEKGEVIEDISEENNTDLEE